MFLKVIRDTKTIADNQRFLTYIKRFIVVRVDKKFSVMSTFLSGEQRMRSGKKNIVLRCGVGCLIVLGVALPVGFFGWVLPAFYIGSGYVAKVVGSVVFTAERPFESAIEEDVGPWTFFSIDIDKDTQSVTASVCGLAKQTAQYQPGLGVHLMHGEPLPELGQRPKMFKPTDWGEKFWPFGSAVASPSKGNAVKKLSKVIKKAFKEHDLQNPVLTRGVVVIHGGKLIAEHYGTGFDSETRMAGWSMTKSITNALIGILVHEGKLRVTDRACVPEWSSPDDPRFRLTINHLLHMTTGLTFEETYSNIFGDATKMLFVERNAGAYAVSKRLIRPIGKRWSYSSGTTNILSSIIRRAVGESDYWEFPSNELFKPIGMYSAIIEPDASGTFVGSSFGWATARDWARFGQLFLNDGVWNGKRLLPSGWVKYSVAPTAAAKGRYAAHWWTNDPNEKYPDKQPLPDCPRDTFFASGFHGQRVFVVPSRDAVVVRLGLTRKRGAFDFNAFLRDVLQALPR